MCARRNVRHSLNLHTQPIKCALYSVILFCIIHHVSSHIPCCTVAYTCLSISVSLHAPYLFTCLFCLLICFRFYCRHNHINTWTQNKHKRHFGHNFTRKHSHIHHRHRQQHITDTSPCRSTVGCHSQHFNNPQHNN